MYYVRQDELYHYGILGMKWGVRRYQNPDGTRTALGKRRERKGGDLEEGSSASKQQKKSGKTSGKQKDTKKKVAVGVGVGVGLGAMSVVGTKAIGNDKVKSLFTDPAEKEQETTAQQLGRKATKASDSFSKAAGLYSRKKSEKARNETRKSRYNKASKYTEQELRAKVNRMQLEKQYVDLLEDRNRTSGWSTAEKVELGNHIATGILTAGTLAVSAYRVYKKIKG